MPPILEGPQRCRDEADWAVKASRALGVCGAIGMCERVWVLLRV